LEHGGEVLKFMGDGLLAIFPIGNDRDPAEVCARALASAYEARRNVAALNRSTRIEVGGVRFGLALHVGDVLYGNIGGGDRLDFTCIGAAVNLAARLEKLAGKLGRVISPPTNSRVTANPISSRSGNSRSRDLRRSRPSSAFPTKQT